MKRLLLSLIVLMLTRAGGLAKNPSEQYCAAALARYAAMEKQIPSITAVAETVAQRLVNGGRIGIPPPFCYQSLGEELCGRAGGLVRFSLDRSYQPNPTAAEKSNDVVVIDWARPPATNELALMKGLKERGIYLVGLGRASMPELAEHIKLCDAFLDMGVADDRAVALADGTRAGRLNHLVNAAQAWLLVAEVVSACTRQGKMPTLYRSMFCDDAQEWNARMLKVGVFHDDLTIDPIPAGSLATAYLSRIREYTEQFQRTQLKKVRQAANALFAEVRDGKKALVLAMGHMPYTYIGKYEDGRWTALVDFSIPAQKPALLAAKPEGRLALRIGYFGESPEMKEILREQKVRLLYVSANHPNPAWEVPADAILRIDMGIPFGDACVPIKGYPIPVFPPSGIMQVVAYESVNVELLARLAKRPQTAKE
jgi:uncharacterized phosphosugar-binding protein